MSEENKSSNNGKIIVFLLIALPFLYVLAILLNNPVKSPLM